MQQEFADFPEDIQEFCHYPDANVTKIERQTAIASYRPGQLVGVASGEWSGQRHICLADEEKSTLTGLAGAQPVISAGGAGVWLAFIEYTDVWQVRAARLENGQVEEVFTVHSSKKLCMQPAVCSADDQVLIAWVEETAAGLRPQTSLWAKEKWSQARTIEVSSGHCFRPAIAKGEHWLLAFDRSVDKRHFLEVILMTEEFNVLVHDQMQRDDVWLYGPVCAAARDRYAIACVAQSLVIDPELEIIDHDTDLCYCELVGGVRSELQRVCSLNDGLLGEKLYTPYFGIRRRCHLIFNAEDLWLLWEGCHETMSEPTRSIDAGAGFSFEHYGHLLGQRRTAGQWHDPVILHQGGINYSVVTSQPGEVGICYIDSAYLNREPQVKVERCSLEQLNVYQAQARSGRWQPYTLPDGANDRYTAECGGEELHLYWADTHVHSRLCPDAEGEPDLLIQSAQTKVGLDFLCLIDNDFYPYAGVMHLEWARIKALAELYTRSGIFVLLPGYEFTFHDKNLEPNFNHRYVLYPTGGGFYSRTDAASRDLNALAPLVAKDGGIMVAHHPNFQLIDHPIDHYAEICSSWRVSMEEKNEIRNKLRSGQKLTFIGSSDTHRALPGLGGALTGVYATSLEPEAIFEAYRKGRTIATQGNRTVLDLKINGNFIGSNLQYPAGTPLVLELNVRAERQIEWVEIICNDSVLLRLDSPGLTVTQELTDTAKSEPSYYYVRLKLIGDPSFNEPDADPDRYSGPFIRSGRYPFNFARANGPFAWSTPIYIEP